VSVSLPEHHRNKKKRSLEKLEKRGTYTVRLTLRLPSNILHAEKSDKDLLHAIATGNMLPAFVTEADGTLRELPTICVDSSEFVVSKLKDRGTHQAFGVVTNAQDFMHILRLYVEREMDQRRPAVATAEPAVAASR